LDDSPILHGSPGDLDRLGLAHVAADADASEPEPPSVDTHGRGGVLPVVGVAPALAKGTAGVERTGEAETAMAAKLEALVPWAQGMAGREVEKLPREGKRIHELSPEALPQEGERKPEALPRKAGRMLEAATRGQGRTRYIAAREPERGQTQKRVRGAATERARCVTTKGPESGCPADLGPRREAAEGAHRQFEKAC